MDEKMTLPSPNDQLEVHLRATSTSSSLNCTCESTGSRQGTEDLSPVGELAPTGSNDDCCDCTNCSRVEERNKTQQSDPIPAAFHDTSDEHDAISTSSSQSSSTVPQSASGMIHRAVHWGVARVYPIPALSEFSPSLMEATWFQAKDYAAMSRENMDIIDQLMKYGNVMGEEGGGGEVTSRGLEQLTEDEIKRRNRLRDGAIDAVLDEQDRQYEEDRRPTPTCEAVAAVYAPFSRRAYHIAQRIGKQDADIARAIFDAADDDVEEAKQPASSNPTNNSTTTTTITTTAKRRIVRRAEQTIRFSPMVHVKPVLSLNDYSLEEIARTWYGEDEVKQFKIASKKLIRSLLKSNIVPLPPHLFDLEEVEEEGRSLHDNHADTSSDRDHEGDNKKNIRSNNVVTIITTAAAAAADSSIHFHCIRGLEPFLLRSKIGGGSRKDNVSRTWTAVLDEQDRQDALRQYHPAQLAQASRTTSGTSGKVARRLALLDEEFAKAYLQVGLQQWGIALDRTTPGTTATGPTATTSSTKRLVSATSGRGKASSRSGSSSAGSNSHVSWSRSQPRITLDYRRDSLSLAGPASKEVPSKRGNQDIPECITASIKEPPKAVTTMTLSSLNRSACTTLEDAPASPHPLCNQPSHHRSHGYRQNGGKVLLPLTKEVVEEVGISIAPCDAKADTTTSADQQQELLCPSSPEMLACSSASSFARAVRSSSSSPSKHAQISNGRSRRMP